MQWNPAENETGDWLGVPVEYTLIDKPLWWHEKGLQQTASGYGGKLTSRRVAKLADGRERRVYVTCYGNNGTAWITIDGKQYVVR
jgi:hypothetical protein